MRRTLLEQSPEGKLFAEFVALIYLSYIKKRMDAGLFRDYTLQGLLDKLDVIECFEHPGHKLQVGEILRETAEHLRGNGVSKLRLFVMSRRNPGRQSGSV